MDEERKSWDRMGGESPKWFSRFDKFRLMKPWERSVNAVFQEEERAKKGEKGRIKPPGVWYKIAEERQWNERAEAWDKYQRDERDRLIAIEEEEILRLEYALRHNRIKDLNEIAKLLREELFDDDKRWTEDVKVVGKEAHYVKQFNDEIIREYRATLDDIAKEKGERVKKQELTGKDGGPVLIKTQWGTPQLTEDTLEEHD